MGRWAYGLGGSVPIEDVPGRRKAFVTRLAAAVALSAVLLVGASAAPAGARTDAAPAGTGATVAVPPIDWGVADDLSKYSDDGGAWFYQQLAGANLTENRWTLAWDPGNPTAIDDLPFVERAAPLAQEAGVHIVLSLYSKQASQHPAAAFCAWAGTVASTVAAWGIHDYIVWNEPNTRLYWLPQKNASGRDVAARAYEALLAACYDSIHAADPDATVIGMGLSPRASTADSTEPLVFLRDVGAAYRASRRTAPIMDQLSIHPYPNPARPADSPAVGYQVIDRYGVPNLDRVKQAVWDAFHGTGQPTTVFGSVRHSSSAGELTGPLTFRIDEIGWQTQTDGLPQYVNAENVPVVSTSTQTRYLRMITDTYFACDPSVTDVELFLLVDEKYRNGRDETGKYLGGGWQSGLLTAGGEGVSEPKPAYTALGTEWAAGRAACNGPLVRWSPMRNGQPAAAPGLQEAPDRGPRRLPPH